MENIRSHFVFNRSQRNGIFVLVVVILVLQVLYFFLAFPSEGPVPREQDEEIAGFQQKVDSLKRVAAIRDSVAVLPFNPNYISDHKGYVLGMSVEEIDRLHLFRAGNAWVNSPEEFQQVTGVSDSLLARIAPSFRFPDWVREQTVKVPPTSGSPVVPVEKQDLNSATAEALMEVRGIGETLSERIVKYRTRIGGFRSPVQLQDVYGLNRDLVNRLSGHFEVFDAGSFQKADINTIEVIPLSEIPYFNYELAREVVNFRKLRGGIKSFEELDHIKGFPVEKIDRIQLYLTIN